MKGYFFMYKLIVTDIDDTLVKIVIMNFSKNRIIEKCKEQI